MDQLQRVTGAVQRRRVRVLFGQQVIATYSAEAALADRYAASVSRRFLGLEVKVDDLLTGKERPVPCEQLWDVAPT